MSIKKEQISKRCRASIKKYVEAAMNLYGIIKVDDFVDLFNRYEGMNINAEELRLVILQLGKERKVDCYISGDLIVDGSFSPLLSADAQRIEMLLMIQAMNPRYLPTKEEFLKYKDPFYKEPEMPYDDLKAYICEHELMDKDAGEFDIEYDLNFLFKFIQTVYVDEVYALQLFVDWGYTFQDDTVMDEFMRLLMNAYDNTRLHGNNGFTSSEIFEAQGGIGKTMHEFSGPASSNVPSRNALCPCNSGKKYKRCCGILN